MIIDLERFITEEMGRWSELEGILERIQRDPHRAMPMEDIKRFHYLYQRTSADLAKIMTFSSEPEVRRYLEALVARAYTEIHETRTRPYRISPLTWLFSTLPRTFRKHMSAFLLATAVMAAGFAFGGFAVTLDPGAKAVILPFSHLQADPGERVAEEEKTTDDKLKGRKITGASWYMTHNTRVSVAVVFLGITWGVGTVVILFYNGVILGAVALDYVLAGQAGFLAAWLSPHGVIEIPAVLLAGQAGLVLAGALIGWGKRTPLRVRMRIISNDLVTLVFGVAVMLVWAGVIEAFVSGYHEPFLPYWLKTGFGLVELFLLVWFLSRAGRKDELAGQAPPAEDRS